MAADVSLQRLRIWPPLMAMVSVVSLATLSGCAAVSDEVTTAESDLGARSAGIEAGSPEEEGVILLVNDRALDANLLESRIGLRPTPALAIERYRTTTDDRPRWFTSIAELDDLPVIDRATFELLLKGARTLGYAEAPGFDPPLLARISVPDDLGRPPTSNDVTVEAGFDGKSPAEVRAIVEGRITNEIDPENESFVGKTVEATHKAFTIAVGNLFAQGSPHATFAASLGAERLTMLGTMSAVTPTILVAESGGVTTYYARGASGYAPIAKPKYPVIMRARVRLAHDEEGQGVRIFYPPWSATVLVGPTTTLQESG